MVLAVRCNILYIGFLLFVSQSEAGLLDSLPIVGNQNQYGRPQGGRSQTNQWMGNNNNAMQGVANALVGLTENSDQNSGANFNLNGQGIGVDSRFNNAANLGRLNWNNMNQRPTFNNINKPNAGRDPLEKEKEDLEKLLERLKELNRIKDAQKNNGTTPTSNNNINNETQTTTSVPIAVDNNYKPIKNNVSSWKIMTKRKIVFQMNPVFPDGDSPPASYKPNNVYFLD